MSGRRLRLLLACVVALLLTAALTPPARAAVGAGELAPATLTVSPASQTVTYRGRATLSGSVSVANAQLALLRQRAGETGWTPLRTLAVGPHGAFTLTVAPPVNTDYKLAFAGDPDHGGAEAVVTVYVRPRILTDFPPSLWLGGAVTLRGSVAPAHVEGTVVIERLVEGAWQTLATTPLRATSSDFVYRWTPSTFGFFHLRARVDADADHLAGASAASRVIVNRPNAHKVPYKFEHYIVIVVHEYRLYYYEHGKMVRAFNVALGRPGFPTPIGLFHIYTKRRPGGGALGACVMFYHQPGGIAIHGTDQQYLLKRFPRPFSHGCARMYNAQALWLYARCPLGTPVHNFR